MTATVAPAHMTTAAAPGEGVATVADLVRASERRKLSACALYSLMQQDRGGNAEGACDCLKGGKGHVALAV